MPKSKTSNQCNLIVIPSSTSWVAGERDLRDKLGRGMGIEISVVVGDGTVYCQF